MGLDWQPLGRPKPGHEAEFNRLFEKLMDGVRAATRARERMRAIEVSPFETLGAPRIGFDEQADRWAEEQYRQRPATEPSVSLESFMQDLHGCYVLEILPWNDGLPPYTNGSFGGWCELYSFRAQFLDICEDVIDEDLLKEAWGDHTAAELVDYGGRLRDRAVAFAERHGLTGMLAQRDPPETEEEQESPAGQVHIVISAARWCLFWGERGHAMLADF